MESDERKHSERHKFTPEEDEMIRDMVERQNIRKWSHVARALGDRTARQCRDRWKNYLSPDVKNQEWTAAEDNMLYISVMRMGPQWSKIAKLIDGRTDVSLKNRWSQMQRYWRRQGGVMQIQMAKTATSATAQPVPVLIRPVAKGSPVEKPKTELIERQIVNPDVQFFLQDELERDSGDELV